MCQEFLKVEVTRADSAKMTQFTQSLGVCWLTLAVVCQLSTREKFASSTLVGLIVFHALNTAVIVRHSESVVDAAFSVVMGLVTALAYKRGGSFGTSKTE